MNDGRPDDLPTPPTAGLEGVAGAGPRVVPTSPGRADGESSTIRNDVAAGLLAAFIGGAGVSHFTNPEFFDAIIPDWIPGPVRAWTLASGVVEIACALLLIPRATRKKGALLALATFIGVWPANISAALEGGYDLDPPGDSAAVAWLRVPLQIPMFVWAWFVARGAD